MGSLLRHWNHLSVPCTESKTGLRRRNRAACHADAKDNARRNGIQNAEFYVGKAEEILPHKYETENVKADVIVVDPPRKGCDEALLETIVKMQPERVVYVSCDSATLARDLKYLTANGYKAERLATVDMFPMTVHVESAVKLVRE
mgnify:FL=1